MCRSSLRGEQLQLEAVAQLQRVVGFDRWCWPLADPETLVPGMGLADHDYGPGLPRALELEFGGRDFSAKDAIARRAWPVGSLSGETGGDLARSPRWDEVLRPVGIGDTATVACRDRFGCWGWIEAYRDASDRPFTDDVLELLVQVGPALGQALRRSVIARPAARAATASEPAGVLVLDRELRTIGHTSSARGWMDALPAAPLFAAWGIMPPPIYPVATLAREGQRRRAHAVVPAVDGRLVRVEATGLDGGAGQVAVVLRAATPEEGAELVCRAHGLTRRERQLVSLLMQGLDTTAVTKRMGISGHTVQDHLKAVFVKVGVRSRRELIALLHGQPATETRTDHGIV